MPVQMAVTHGLYRQLNDIDKTAVRSYSVEITELGRQNYLMNEQTDILRQIRDLLLLIAEPALEKRDEKFRATLRGLVGRSKLNAKAVLLMDGTKTRAAIHQDLGIDRGNLSRLITSLRNEGLLSIDENPKLVISIPANFFEGEDK